MDNKTNDEAQLLTIRDLISWHLISVNYGFSYLLTLFYFKGQPGCISELIAM